MKTGMDMDMDMDVQLLRHTLQQTTEPARRHRCDLCKVVFECHICTTQYEHVLHGGQGHHIESRTNNAVLVCETCIEQNELWVEVCHGRTEESVLRRKRMSKLKSYASFYDHVTGRLIGYGVVRYK